MLPGGPGGVKAVREQNRGCTELHAARAVFRLATGSAGLAGRV
jgi:hypothetical protein